MAALALKTALALTAVSWLVSTERLDLLLVARLLDHPGPLGLAFGLFLVQNALAGLRLKVLLDGAAPRRLPGARMVGIGWIGLFFGTFLPGTVTGDIVKVFYIRRLAPSLSKSFLLTSVVLDRAMGLSALVLVMGLSLPFSWGALAGRGASMRSVLTFDLVLVAAVAAGLSLLLLAPGRSLAPALGRLGRLRLEGVAGALRETAGRRGRLACCLLLSLLVQLLHVCAFWVLTRPFHATPLPLPWILALYPLGELTVVLPVAPVGIGVGHAAFQALFSLLGEPGGANLFNLDLVVTVAVNLLGAVPFVLAGARPPPGTLWGEEGQSNAKNRDGETWPNRE